MNTIRLMDRPVGGGGSPFFVAELGICHGGDVAVALDLAAAAIEAGADCVKTETFNRANMVFDTAATCSYVIRGKRITEPLGEHMDRFSLTLEEHHRVKRLCEERGVPFMSTAHDFAAVDFLASIGAAAIKIASPDIVHYPLLRHAAASALPVFLDTGSALRHEVDMAVRTLRHAGCAGVVVNHNPAGHPAPAECHDLRIMQALRTMLDTPTGLADHYEGYEMLYAATALGADCLEKPISLDRFVEEPERNWSITAADLPEVLRIVRETALSLGRNERVLTPEQENYRNQNRMACCTARAVQAGEVLDFSSVIFGRPRRGIGVEHWDLVAGLRFSRDMGEQEFITWGDIA
ncbi:MAG: N-acetylneuraminate synthase family protein [Thermodesulfobacteriota bacterium]